MHAQNHDMYANMSIFNQYSLLINLKLNHIIKYKYASYENFYIHIYIYRYLQEKLEYI